MVKKLIIISFKDNLLHNIKLFFVILLYLTTKDNNLDRTGYIKGVNLYLFKKSQHTKIKTRVVFIV